MVKLVTVGTYYGVHEPFSSLFDRVEIAHLERIPPKINEGDIVLFGGGEDIGSSIYKQKPSKYGSQYEPSRRDRFEIAMYEDAKAAGAKFLGICRGAQLLCALSGGSLIQHVTHHAGPKHWMRTNDNELINVCSVHHQMMNPFKIKHELIGWSENRLSSCYLIEGDKNIEMEKEPEIVFFPETKALGIQYHPEFMDDADRAVIYAKELVKQYLLD